MPVVDLSTSKTESRFFERALSKAEESIELSFLSLRKQILIRNWCWLCLANLAAWYYEESYASPAVSTLPIRVAICLVAIPLFLSKYSTASSGLVRFQKSYLLIFFTLQLPFMFGLTGLLNAANTPEDQLLSGVWFFEYMFALFLFYGFLSTARQTAVICSIAHLVALAIAIALNPLQAGRTLEFSIGMVSTQLTMFVFATLTHRRMQFVNQEKLEAAYAVGSKVAHEIRTPLLTIRNLVHAAEISLKQQVRPQSSAEGDLQLRENLDRIRREVTYANTTIDMLLVSSTGAPFNYDKSETTDIEKSILEAN